MKIKQTNDKGEEEEIEVSTAEEVASKIATEKAAIEEEHKKALEEVNGKISTIDQEKKDLQKKIDDMVASGMNADNPSFKVLKEALDKKDIDIKDLRKSLDEDKSQRAQEEMDSAIKIASKGNAEVEKKIKFHLENTLVGLKDGTKAERQTKLDAAIKLSSDTSGDGPGIFDQGTGGGGKGADGKGGEGSGVEFTAKERALGAKLGLTPDDYKKYANRVSKK